MEANPQSPRQTREPVHTARDDLTFATKIDDMTAERHRQLDSAIDAGLAETFDGRGALPKGCATEAFDCPLWTVCPCHAVADEALSPASEGPQLCAEVLAGPAL
jgi:hypothetical protein